MAASCSFCRMTPPRWTRRVLDASGRPLTAGPGMACCGSGRARSARSFRRSLPTGASSAARFVTALCTRPDIDERRAELPPPPEDLEALAAAAPVMPGAEYLTADVLLALWAEIGAGIRRRAGRGQDHGPGVPQAPEPGLERRRPGALQPRREPQGRAGAVRLPRDLHRPALGARQGPAPAARPGAARVRGGGQQGAAALAALPVQRAAERCAWLKRMVDAGEIFHPLRWSPQEAFRFLGDVPELERAGVVVRMPATWKAGRPPRPQVTATVGAKAPSALGRDALLDFRMEVTLDGERLTPAEVKEILAGANGLALIRGQWVEVDRERLRRHDGAVPGGRTARGRGRALVRRGDADARRRGNRRGQRGDRRRSRLVARRRGALACRDPQGAALARGAREGRSRARAARHPAALPAGRRPLAPPAVAARPGRLPRRRHGPRQDHPGARAAARAAARTGARTPPEPAGGPGLAAGQLGGGDRTVRAGAQGDHRAPVGHAGRRTEGACAREARRRRPRHHELRLAPAHSLARYRRVAPRGPRRGPGDQEPGRQADPRRQEARGLRRGSRSPAPPSKTGWGTCGRSSISSTRGCSDRPGSSRATPSASRTGRTILTDRCAISCGPTSCGASRPTGT